MNPLFSGSGNFASLSIKDLLYGRKLFHYHLLNKKNVAATAIGLYRIRKSDPWPERGEPNPKVKSQTPRTLFNSEVRSYSWPCIYVFVYKWEEENKLKASNPIDVVPKTVYLPDGRSIPICVIEAQKQDTDRGMEIRGFAAGNGTLGPGSPIINKAGQGLTRAATAGCIVKDADKYYVLTSKHAIGQQGTDITSTQVAWPHKIGKASGKYITRKSFAEVYPNFESTDQYLNLDIGLVELDEVKNWRTSIPNIPSMEDVLDLYDNNFSLQLIGQNVLGFGAVSGPMRGEIQGLFYRYKSSGGYEYISDFLIGPVSQDINESTDKDFEKRVAEDKKQNLSFHVEHGDSGAILFIEEKLNTDGTKPVETTFRYHPFAVLWGKNEILDKGQRLSQPFALATSLSVALNFLELDLVRDFSLDNNLIWGYIGHYAIASKLGFTINLLKSEKLARFISKNEDLLAMPDNDIRAHADSPRVIGKDEDGNYDDGIVLFVPLADVPDNVWKSNVNFANIPQEDGTKKRVAGKGVRGIRDHTDNANHFADIDLPVEDAGKTLLELSLADDFKNLNPTFWLQFYKKVAPQYKAWSDLYTPEQPFDDKKHWGALPFRVAQIVDFMIEQGSKGNQAEFLCAGGVLIHYVGDACQPLHSSYKSQGDVDHPEDYVPQKGKNAGKTLKKMRGDGVHSGYEDAMVNAHSKDIMDGLEDKIKELQVKEDGLFPPVNTGQDAAIVILKLIDATRNTLMPDDIIDEWIEAKKLRGKAQAEAMWGKFSDQTIEVMARGCIALAAIWQGAWEKSNADDKIGEGDVLTQKSMQNLYNDPEFLPSFPLDKY